MSEALTEIDDHYIGKNVDPATGIGRTYPVSLGFVQSHQLMMLCTRHGFLDLFSYLPGQLNVNVEELYRSSVMSSGFRYASLEWLRKLKVASGRTKDLLDLEELPKE